MARRAGKVNAKLSEKPGAAIGNSSTVIIQHDMPPAEKGIGKRHTETTGKMIVTRPCLTEGSGAPGRGPTTWRSVDRNRHEALDHPRDLG